MGDLGRSCDLLYPDLRTVFHLNPLAKQAVKTRTKKQGKGTGVTQRRCLVLEYIALHMCKHYKSTKNKEEMTRKHVDTL